MKEPVGGIKPIDIDIEEPHTYKELKNNFVDSMKNDDNKSYFHNSTVKIGNFQGTIYESFIDKEV